MLPSPGLPSFDYVRPETPQEVARLLFKSNGDARLFMGGTDVFVRMRDGFYAPKILIDVKHLPGMREIAFGKRKGLTIGAAVDMNSLARHPVSKRQSSIARSRVPRKLRSRVANIPLRSESDRGSSWS